MPPHRDHINLNLDDHHDTSLDNAPGPSTSHTFYVAPPDQPSPNDVTHSRSPSSFFTTTQSPFAASGLATAAPPRGSHGKKRDASYIPRPPNAFILFRSSFIRSQQVPGKVEGSHSTLSKIIGMYWKALPREEREKWEAKAVIAQAEHRQQYPDWRFRPGANALAKLKSQDVEPRSSVRRRSSRSTNSRNEEEGDEVVDSKGKGKANPKQVRGVGGRQEQRVEKIATFLAEGKKGAELERAVQEWERENGRKKRGVKPYGGRPPLMVTTPLTSEVIGSGWGTPGVAGEIVNSGIVAADDDLSGYTERGDSKTPVSGPSSSSDVTEMLLQNLDSDRSGILPSTPLTHMFRRSPSPSAPPSPSRLSYPLEDPARQREAHLLPLHHQLPSHDTFSSPIDPASGIPYDPHRHQLSWQQENERHPYEHAPKHEHWWAEIEKRGDDDEDHLRPENVVLTTTGMGYAGAETGQYHEGYMEQYQTNVLANPGDGSHTVNWRANPGSQGLVAVIEDPYLHQQKFEMDGCSPPPNPSGPIPIPIPSSPPPFSPHVDSGSPMSPGLDDGSSHYHHLLSPLPSSSFSTLTGWAGDNDSTPVMMTGGWGSSVLPAPEPTVGWDSSHQWGSDLEDDASRGGHGVGWKDWDGMEVVDDYVRPDMWKGGGKAVSFADHEPYHEAGDDYRDESIGYGRMMRLGNAYEQHDDDDDEIQGGLGSSSWTQ